MGLPSLRTCPSRRQSVSQLRTPLMVTLLQSPWPGWSVHSSFAALPWPPFCRPHPHGHGPPEHSPLSLEGPASRGIQTMGDNSWGTRRDTLNHVGPASSPANLSHDTQTAPCWGSHVRLQTQRIHAGLACHSRQAEAGWGSGRSRRLDPTHPSAQGHGPVQKHSLWGGASV